MGMDQLHIARYKMFHQLSQVLGVWFSEARLHTLNWEVFGSNFTQHMVGIQPYYEAPEDLRIKL